MNILLIAGDRTRKLVESLNTIRQAVDVVGIKTIDDIEDYFKKGQVFDRVIVMFPGYDDREGNYTLGSRIEKFTDIVKVNNSIKHTFVFVANEMETAKDVVSSTTGISKITAVVLINKVTLTTLGSLVLKDLNVLADEFKLVTFKDLYESAQSGVEESSESEDEYNPSDDFGTEIEEFSKLEFEDNNVNMGEELEAELPVDEKLDAIFDDDSISITDMQSGQELIDIDFDDFDLEEIQDIKFNDSRMPGSTEYTVYERADNPLPFDDDFDEGFDDDDVDFGEDGFDDGAFGLKEVGEDSALESGDDQSEDLFVGSEDDLFDDSSEDIFGDSSGDIFGDSNTNLFPASDNDLELGNDLELETYEDLNISEGIDALNEEVTDLDADIFNDIDMLDDQQGELTEEHELEQVIEEQSAEEKGQEKKKKGILGGLKKERPQKQQKIARQNPNKQVQPDVKQLEKRQPKISNSDIKGRLQDRFRAFQKSGNVIVVTGPVGSGKTTIAANLANVATKYGLSSIVVDFDTLGRGHSYINKENYNAVNSSSLEVSDTARSLSQDDVSQFQVVKPGYHVMTTGLAYDYVHGSNVFNTDRLNSFVHKLQGMYNYIVIDVPFELVTNEMNNLLYTVDNVLLTVECSNYGLMNFLLQMSNIENSSADDFLTKSSMVILNKYKNIPNILGSKARRNPMENLDVILNDISGIPEHFSDLEIIHCIPYNDGFDKAIMTSNFISDSKDGENLFAELMCKIHNA